MQRAWGRVQNAVFKGKDRKYKELELWKQRNSAGSTGGVRIALEYLSSEVSQAKISKSVPQAARAG